MMSTELGTERSCGSGNTCGTSLLRERTANISAGFCFFSVKNDVAVTIAALCSLKNELSATEDSGDVLLKFLKNEKCQC